MTHGKYSSIIVSLLIPFVSITELNISCVCIVPAIMNETKGTNSEFLWANVVAVRRSTLSMCGGPNKLGLQAKILEIVAIKHCGTVDPSRHTS
jgi:hypothetical protein